MVTPVLFVGCVSEKTSLIEPKIIEKKITTLKTTLRALSEQNLSRNLPVSNEKNVSTHPTLSSTIFLSNKDKLLASAIFGGTIEDQPYETSIISNESLITQTLSLNDEWEAFSKEDEILETAKNFLGVKYIWAANGPYAFDCSGFTKYVFKESGIALPRHSGHQANIGEKVQFQNLEKGDLVFFNTNKKFTRRVNHVGIFIGDNKFIHASSAKKKVIIASFTEKKFYKNQFLHARRIINANESFALNISPTKKHGLLFN